VMIEQKSYIKGDARSVSIAAASILAKTHRDMRMEEWDTVYPQYGPRTAQGVRNAGSPGSPATAWGIAASSALLLLPVRDAGCWATGAIQIALLPEPGFPLSGASLLRFHEWLAPVRVGPAGSSGFIDRRNADKVPALPTLGLPPDRLSAFAAFSPSSFLITTGITGCSHPSGVR